MIQFKICISGDSLLIGTKGDDSSGNSMSLETPQWAPFANEEAQAMPTESDRL